MGALDGSALPPYQNQPTTGTAIPNWPTDDQLANQASMISLPHDVMSFFEPSSSSDLLASTAAPIVNLGPASGQTSVNPSLSPSISAEFAEYLVETVVADASSEKEVLDSGSPGRALVAPEDVTSETVVALPTWTESAREMTSNQENTPSSPPDTNAARLLAPSWISSALKFIGLERRTQKEEVHRSTNVDASSSKSRYSPYPARPGMFDTPKSDRSPLGEIQLPRNQPLIRRADHVPRQRKLKKLEAYVPTRRKFKKTLNEFIPKQRQMRRLKKDFDIPKEN
ncbi:hypothetical protein CPB97_005526 [Podila verticillata]|nr:hypothetical protein CPB97_005526 [Podila verticillata]